MGKVQLPDRGRVRRRHRAERHHSDLLLRLHQHRRPALVGQRGDDRRRRLRGVQPERLAAGGAAAGLFRAAAGSVPHEVLRAVPGEHSK